MPGLYFTAENPDCVKNHPQYQKAKSKNTPLTPYDLREEVFFAPWENAEENISEDITGYLSPYGFTPRLQFLHNASSVLCAVRCGQGAAIVNTWSSAAGDPEICKIPLDIHDHVCLARMGYGKNIRQQLRPAFLYSFRINGPPVTETLPYITFLLCTASK